MLALSKVLILKQSSGLIRRKLKIITRKKKNEEGNKEDRNGLVRRGKMAPQDENCGRLEIKANTDM